MTDDLTDEPVDFWPTHDPIFTFEVGYTTTRPIVPDEHTAWVTVSAPTEEEATIRACLMTMHPELIVQEDHVSRHNSPNRAGVHRRATQMPTRATLLAVSW